MTDRIDVEELVERLKGLAAEGALIHTFSWGLVVSLLSDAATAISALEKERDEALKWNDHACERIGVLQDRAQAAETELSALKALVGRMVEGLEPFAAIADVLGPTKDAAIWAGQKPAPPVTFGDLRRARSLLSEAKGEGER